MPYKEFLDAADVRWRVWATYPSVGKVLSRGFENGWLTFESLSEKRRLIPIPTHWEDLTQAELRSLCERAKRIARAEGSANTQ